MISLNNYLRSGFSFKKSESELQFKYQFFNILLALNLFVVTTAAFIRFLREDNTQAIVDIVYSIVGIIVIFLVRKDKKYFDKIVYFVMFFSLLIVSFTYINHTNAYVGISWFFVQIIIVVFLSNRRFSYLMLGLSIIIILTTQYLKMNSEDFSHAIFGIFPLIVFSIFMTAYETRNKIQADLLKEQHALLKKYTFEIEHFDFITHLPNRISFTKHLNRKVFTQDQENFSIIKIDIDDFKNINETHGFNFADKIVFELSERLKEILTKEMFLSKSGPDEFLVLIESDDIEILTAIANDIMKVTKDVFCINNQRIFITISVGITRFPDDTNSSADLIKNVDTALHMAKKSGKNCARFYDLTLTDALNEKMQLLLELQDAALNNEFETYFQPQVDAKNNTIVGMEALVRWIHPKMGIIAPTLFIPLAEENSLIKDIDFFVMKDAMKSFVAWKKEYPNIGRLSLNLSMKLLEDKEYLRYLQDTLKETSFKAEWLEIEITESQLMNDPQKSIKLLQEIRNFGINISIDDFGTGYSSLAYLQKLPVSKLKIDRSFIIDTPKDSNSVTLVNLIINLAHSLNLNVIAEGIEEKEQKDFLLSAGCSYIQGYYYSKPLSSTDMLLFIKKYQG
jgi:diguanylate cyclase (GGDEF)-like protein